MSPGHPKGSPAFRRFCFGSAEFDERSLSLTVAGDAVKAQPLTLELLRYFLVNRGRVVTRDELLREVWDDVIVSDAALAQAVAGLRRALGVQSTRVETVRGRGYRFHADVSVRPSEGPEDHPMARDAVRMEARHEAPFAGRLREIAGARGVFGDAMAARGGVLLLSGAPAMGKTRLAEELSCIARGIGFEVSWSRCMAVEGAPPFFVWAAAIREVLACAEPVINADDRAHIEATFLRATPSASAASEDNGPASTRFHAFEALGRALAARAELRPLVLVLDDLQRADAASLELLEFLAAALRGARVVLVGAYRPCSAEPLARLAARPHAQVYRLAGLDRCQSAALLSAAMDPPGDAHLEDLLDQTGGNPLLLWELARAGTGALPPRVLEVVRERIRGLPAPCAELLAVAAVCGRTFDAPLLARALGREVIDVLDALGPALGEGLIEEVSAVAQQYRFAERLVRDTLYADESPARRALLHAVVAEALSARGSDDLAELALHWQQAVSLGHGARAVELTCRAAEAAMCRLAFEEAATLCERLLAARSILSQEDAFDIQLQLASALLRAGHIARARGAFERALDTARALGSGAAVAEAVAGLADTRLDGDDLLDDAWEALLLEGIEGAGDDGVRARLLARLAFDRWLAKPDEEAPEPLARQAVQVARESQDPDALAIALGRYHRLAVTQPSPNASLALSQELLGLRPRLSEAAARIEACSSRAWDMLRLYRRRDFDTALIELEHEIARSPSPRSWWYGHVHRAALAHLSGRFAEAEGESAAAWDLSRDCPSPFADLCRGIQLFNIHRDWGSDGDWDAPVRALALRGGVITWQLAVGALDARAGACDGPAGTERLRQLLAGVTANRFANVRHHLTYRNALAFAAEITAAIHDAEAAPVIHACLEAHERLADVHVPGLCTRGSLARPLGMLASLMGRHEEACARLAAASLRDRAFGAEPMVAYGLVEQAGAIAARDRRLSGAARALLDEALALAQRHEMRALADHIVALT